jgi:hypothetical protein
LPELLVAMTIGLGVIFAALLVLDNATSLSKRTYQRVDATQRGRLALDLMMRELRSQVCLSSTAPALVSATDTAVRYYVNLGGPDAVPERHELSLTSGDIVLTRWTATGTAPNYTWNAAGSRTLLENVQAQAGVPVFRYYAWGSGDPLLPDALLATPLSAANLGRPVKIAVAFRALPARDLKSTQGASDMQDSVFVRSSDSTNPVGGPRCN